MLRVIPTLHTLLLLPGVLLLSCAARATAGMRISVVTGSNKGIGLAIAKKLAQTPGHLCVLTSRNPALGRAAADGIRREGLESVVYKQLDIGDPSSVQRFASEMEQEYGRCDILVNNAGIAYLGPNSPPIRDQVDPVLKTNFFDTIAFTEKMLPLVRKSSAGRIVNLGSMMGHLSILGSQRRKHAFTDPGLTTEKLSSMMKEYIDDVKSDNYMENGWGSNCYGMSKLALIAYSNVAAKVEKKAGSKVLVNSCCPGYVVTDMTSHMGVLTPEQGARTPYMLTQMKDLEDGGLTGKFFEREGLSRW